MCTQGWGWTVIAWAAEEAWPALPKVAQRALNISNAIPMLPTEVELMSAIVDDGKEVAMEGAGVCASYIDVIDKFVSNYGGGPGAPMVYFLEAFSKEWGRSLDSEKSS